MVFSSNPLALSVPDLAFESWLRDKGYLEILDQRTSDLHLHFHRHRTIHPLFLLLQHHRHHHPLWPRYLPLFPLKIFC
ncbi:unnamed protein product [Coffea canephora]|uniref:Uncharacterized protein n=1 Tax=Coffea canephora TaxID=49390 RepID=A0A068TZ69_COFCA|nr:unnamed protein product [Coffea canephora]